MSHITTYSGEDFNPLSPNPSQIKITDIAHALSLMCRANGHFMRFYSVAQHCINCAMEAKARNYSKKVQLACLLHDASEAYISDLTRPVKRSLDGYVAIEAKLQETINRKFIEEALSEQDWVQLEEIDDDLLVCEFMFLMKKPVFETAPTMKGMLTFETLDFGMVENQYIQLFNQLTHVDEDNTKLTKDQFLSVGIDGCKGKWLAVALSNQGYQVNLFDRIDQVCDYYKNADSVLVDMPIGLAESKVEIRPDTALRKKLPGKASSVFNTPCRQAVYETDYSTSSNLNNEVLGNKLSRQSFAITPKIKEVDVFLQTHPEWKNRLLESHPEYCFALLNDGNPILENKQTSEGAAKRMQVLGKYYPDSFALVQETIQPTKLKC